MNKLIAIIPARGGSKGVPGKNIKKINQIPLLAYPIMAAQRTECISEVYVSTDDEEIKDVALRYGAEVIDRPSKFAQDDSLDIDVMKHAVEHLNHYVDDIDYFLQNGDCTALRSAHEAPETAYKSFKKDDVYWSGLFNDELDGDYYNLPRQSLPKTYNPNGYVDIIRPKHFMNDDNLHGDKMLAYITPFTHDVDTLNDFKLLEMIYG